MENVIGSVSDINNTGSVKLDHGGAPWTVNDADKVINLVTGKPYGYDDVLATETYMQRLERAPMGAQTMTIHVTRGATAGGPYAFVITINGVTTTYQNIQRGDSDPEAENFIYLQSHWGSGVKFTDVKVKKL